MTCSETTEKIMDGCPNVFSLSLWHVFFEQKNILHKDVNIQLPLVLPKIDRFIPKIQIQCTGRLQFKFGMAIL